MNEECYVSRLWLWSWILGEEVTLSKPSLAHHPAIDTRLQWAFQLQDCSQRVSSGAEITWDLVGAVVALPLLTAAITVPPYPPHVTMLFDVHVPIWSLQSCRQCGK